MAIVLREEVLVDRCKYLLENYSFAEFRVICDFSEADAKKEYNKIKKYLRGKVMGAVEAKYDFCKGRNDGRMYGKDSIQTLWKEMRGFVCEGITTDLDFENAHPVILKNICVKADIECPNLKEYVASREKCLEKIMEADNISRAEAKRKILISTNKNTRTPSNCPFFKNYDKEMKRIQQQVQNITEYEYLKPFANKERNFNGSFMNHILCVEENNLLQMVRKCCEENDTKIHALMFDGLMVYGDVSEGFLKTITEYVRRQSSYTDLNITIKPHETSFEIPEGWEAPVYTTYEEMREEFNKHNCKVGDEFIFSTETDMYEYSRTGFQTFHEELKYYDPDAKGEDKMVSFTKRWFEDPEKSRYLRKDNYPKAELCPKDTLNMWRPYPVSLIRKSIDLPRVQKGFGYFMKHIEVLCAFEEKCYDFVRMWIAQMFQYPEHKSCEVVFISKEGAGKGLFLEFFKTIMGYKRVWECTDPQRDLFGQFNGNMRDAVLVIFQEANKSGFYNANDKKKALITDNVININEKGVKKYPMRSYHRFMTFTNNPIPIVPNKRRDVIIRSSDEMIGDKEYFAEGWGYATDEGVCKYIYDYFMDMECKPKIVETDMPITEYHEEMITVHKPLIRQFIEHLVEQAKEGELEETIESDDLYRSFVSFAAHEKQSTDGINKQSFGLKLKYESIDSITKKVKKVDGKAKNVYKFDLDAFVAEVEGL